MSGKVFGWFRSLFFDLCCTYSTVKEVEIRHTYVAIIYRILQFISIGYIAIYIVWIEKGYQDVQQPHGSSIIKVKGVARVSTDKNGKQIIWDAADYLIPPLEENSFFIATRKTITYNQTLSTCPSASNNNLFCNSTYNPCKQGMPTSSSFGILTGNCIPSDNNSKKGLCEIVAWCPEEQLSSSGYRININDLQNFSIFIKTIVTFPRYNIKIRTVKDNTSFSCRFNNDTDRRCPLFSMQYILQNLQDKESRIDLAALYDQGGLIEIQQNWHCNFDIAKEEKECFPTFAFNLLQSGSDKLSPGINYRLAEKFHVNGMEYRTLTKIYGLRFILSIKGEGRRFDTVNLFVAIGSGIGYMIIAQIICEFIFTTCHKYRKAYRQSKVKMCHLKTSIAVENPRVLAHPEIFSETINEFAE